MSNEALAHIDAALAEVFRDAALSEFERVDPRETYETLVPKANALASALRAARAEIVRLSALTPEPPRPQDSSDDEREGVARIVADFVQPGGYEVTESDYLLTDRIMASPEWRNRHRGPITENTILVEVALDREFEQGNEMEGERSAWYANVTGARVLDGHLHEEVVCLAAPYADELDYDGVVQAAISQWVGSQNPDADAEAAR